jgi:hypothetical protein
MTRGYIRKSFHVVIVPSDFQIEAYQFVGLNDMITAIDHVLENFFCVAFFACRWPARNIPNRDFYGRSLLFGQGHDRPTSPSSTQSSFGLTSSSNLSQ